MKIFVLISALVLYGFIAISIKKFGLLTSYSAYSTKWMQELKPRTVGVWDAMTFIAAFCMLPPMIEAGSDNVLQVLGFFAPAYLIAVSRTPEWELNKKTHILHSAFAILCAVIALAWMVFVCRTALVIIPAAIAALVLAMSLHRKDAYVFWGEMVLFVSVHVSLLIIL